MLDATTKRKIDSARQILVGKVPDPKAQVEQITTALVYKFMDDMDKEAEELGGKAKFFTDDLKDFAWSKLLDTRYSGQERMDLYVRAISAFAKAKQLPQLFRDIFKDAFLPYRDPETLSLFLKEIDNFTYDHSEDLGNAFEYLLSVLGSQGDAGQFRTPRHIIDFIVAVVDPKKNETVLDPACGTAGFLISAYKHIRKHNSSNFKPEKEKAEEKLPEGETIAETVLSEKTYRGDLLTPSERSKLMNNFVGYDISPDMVKLSLVNMYLHGFSDPKIYEYDTLTSEKHWGEQFDVIMANPPFMSPRGGIRPHKRFSVQASRSEVLFVDYILEHLALKGRAGIIVPEGIIFKTENAYKQLRQMLVEDGLFSVVSLPPGVFNPYSGVKTSILLFDNELAKKTDEILFLKIENDGFDLGAQRRKIDKNDLPEALEVLEAWKQGKKLVPSAVEGKENNLSLWVKKEKIAESGDYNLTGERYRENALQFINLLRKQAEKDLQKYARILEPTMKQFNDFVSSPQFQTMQKTMQEAVSHFQKAGKNVDLQRIQSALEEVRRASNQKWPLVELGEVCSFEYGKPLKQEDRQGGEYPVFGSNGIVGHHNEYIVQGPFIVVGRKGTAGAVTYSEKSGYPIDTTFYVHLKDGQNIDLKFLYFTLRKLDLGKLNTQAGVPGLNRNDAYKTKIPLPPLEVQKEIVEQIEVKQNAINHAKEIIKNLERERRYFGQSLRKLKDVEWVEFSKYIKTITPPKKIQKSNFGNSGKYPIIDQSQEDISGWTDDGSAVVQIKKPVVIFGDHTCVVKYLDKPFVQGADGIKILQTNDKLLSKFLYYFLRTNLISSDGYKRHFSKLKEIKIPLPPLDVQKQLIVEAEKEEEIIASNRRLIDLMEKKINQVLAKI